MRILIPTKDIFDTRLPWLKDVANMIVDCVAALCLCEDRQLSYEEVKENCRVYFIELRVVDYDAQPIDLDQQQLEQCSNIAWFLYQRAYQYLRSFYLNTGVVVGSVLSEGLVGDNAIIFVEVNPTITI